MAARARGRQGRAGLTCVANRVDVCVCTFQRDSVAATLRSLGDQALPPGVAMRVIVADNNSAPVARARIEAAGREAGLDLRYVHAPERNISIARNACLAAATAPFIAFIDDDETATPGWLAALLAEQARSGAPIVLGPVAASYAPGQARWLAAADLHSTRPALRADGTIDTGYSCNVLLRRDIVAGLAFDERLGRSGGEDDMFFSRLHRAGHRVAYAQEAVVNEEVPAGRARLGWLLRRSFRNGQTFAAIRLADGASRPALLGGSLAKAAFCGGVALAGLSSPARWRRAAVRGALHAGVIGRLLGKRDLELY